MHHPSETDWGVEDIRQHDPDRAAALTAVRSPDDLVTAVAEALNHALDQHDVRIGMDSLNDDFQECRIIIQFRTKPAVHDWFFNGRFGYRAQFWTSAANGMLFNKEITSAVSEVLTYRLPTTVSSHLLVQKNVIDTKDIRRDFIIHSLREPKIWICEDLIQNAISRTLEIGFVLLLDAAQHLPKLNIPRWAQAINPRTKEIGEGLRAPCADQEYAWLDLKGAVVDRNGSLVHFKSPDQRAQQIYELGWT